MPMNRLSKIFGQVTLGFTACLLPFLGLINQSEAKTHALIMTISQYQAGIPPLKGVARDADNATSIAHAMGVEDKDIVYLKDAQLTLGGIRGAFETLDSKIATGDQVFVYYSGHGGRSYVKEPAERCAESLIAVDSQQLVDSEMESYLNKLSSKAQKVIVLFDACHSGGVATRAVNPPFAPKYWSKGEADACEKPINVLTRSINFSARSAGSGAQNYVYIAAAKDNEISLDQPGKGGVATQAWLKCMTGEAVDSDGSGGITAEEVRLCAQSKIDETLKEATGFKAHHISITGNSGLVMKLADTSSTTQAVAESPNPIAALRDIYNGRDDRRVVSLSSYKNPLKIGTDSLEVALTSSHSGYVYLLMVGSDGKTFDILFPNKIDGSNRIHAGETIRLPRPEWEIVVQGPKGKDSLLAIVADSPRDFSSAGMTSSGPFSTVSVNQASAKDIHLVTAASANAKKEECSNVKTRTLAVKGRLALTLMVLRYSILRKLNRTHERVSLLTGYNSE